MMIQRLTRILLITLCCLEGSHASRGTSCFVKFNGFALLARSTFEVVLIAGRTPTKESSSTFLHVYSALHDPVAGAVRVFADVYPASRCTDIKSCHFRGPAGEAPFELVAAKSEVPFGASEIREPLECFVTCLLPAEQKEAALTGLDLKDGEGVIAATSTVERIQVPTQKLGWGMCVGPAFSDVPQFEVSLDSEHIHMSPLHGHEKGGSISQHKSNAACLCRIGCCTTQRWALKACIYMLPTWIGRSHLMYTMANMGVPADAEDACPTARGDPARVLSSR